MSDHASENGHGDVTTVADLLVMESAQREAAEHRTRASTSKLRVLDTLRLLTTEPPPLDWLADGILARGKLTLLGGREKRGKSLIALALAVRMASGGGELAGIAVKPGRVLLIDAENGEREIHRRLRAMGLAATDADQLVAVEARGFELRDDLDQIRSLLDRFEPDLLVLDSFRALWRGDERDEAQVAEALDPLRDLTHDREIATALIHHAQKGGEEYRGSTAIGAAIEWCVMVDRHGDDPDKTRRRLPNPLARFAPEREDRWLSICSDGDDGPVLLAACEPYRPTHEAPVREAVEDELMAVIREGCGGVEPYIDDHTPTPPIRSQADLLRAIGRDPKDWTGREAIKRLVERGVLTRADGGFMLAPPPSDEDWQWQ